MSQQSGTRQSAGVRAKRTALLLLAATGTCFAVRGLVPSAAPPVSESRFEDTVFGDLVAAPPTAHFATGESVADANTPAENSRVESTLKSNQSGSTNTSQSSPPVWLDGQIELIQVSDHTEFERALDSTGGPH